MKSVVVKCGIPTCVRFYIAVEDTDEELQRIIDLMKRKYAGYPGFKLKGEIRSTDTIRPALRSSR